MNTDKIMIFENAQFGQVRTTVIDGIPWLVGKDIADNLGYRNGSRDINRHVDAEDRRTEKVSDGNQMKNTILVNESGMYSLILSSKLPTARAFKHWITSEVLPFIRKNGAYMTDAVIEHLEENPELVPEYLHRLHNENAEAKKLRGQLTEALAQNAKLQPKAEYYDSFVSPDDLSCLRYTAKELGVSQKKLIGYLLEHDYLFRDRHRNGRVFVKAGKRNDPLFGTRDFYTPHARKSEYTLVTPAGKEHLHRLVDSISAWVPMDKRDEIGNGETATEKAVFAK